MPFRILKGINNIQIHDLRASHAQVNPPLPQPALDAPPEYPTELPPLDANADINFSDSYFPQPGHSISLSLMAVEETSSSKVLPQLRHRYSYIGIRIILLRLNYFLLLSNLQTTTLLMFP
jgi:hypothetical protein